MFTRCCWLCSRNGHLDLRAHRAGRAAISSTMANCRFQLQKRSQLFTAPTIKHPASSRSVATIQNCRVLETQPQFHPAFFRLSAIRLPTREAICRVALNGEFGNTRDASVHADGTKSRLPKRVARALRRRNPLRTAIELWGAARSCYGFRDCTAHPTQKEETGGTAPLSSPSHIPQVQSAEKAFLTFPSQLPPISFRCATKCWP